ncbi:MAG: VWA domain-containing protein [Deferrisomatales bacterium]
MGEPTESAAVADGRGMAGHVVAFSRFLKDAGVPSHPQAVLDACRSLTLLDIGDPRQVYWALRANFVTGPEQFALFDRLYRLFWEEGVRELPTAPPPPPPSLPRAAPGSGPFPEAPDGRLGAPDRDASGGASAHELLLRKDLRAIAPEEEPRLREILQALLAKLSTRPSRRYRPAFRGRKLEFRRIFREHARFGGEILRLVHKDRRVRRRRLALLGDVSGSMDVYARFFLLLAHGLARQDSGVEVYTFSTRLVRVTEYLRDRDATRAVERISAAVRGWSGGTRIGQCLARFNEELQRRSRGRDTVVVVFSDGWDRGDPDLLRREMVRLKGATARIFWLNPLKGDPDYTPVCRGMAAALPYVDGFYPAHNVESLARFARQVTRLR